MPGNGDPRVIEPYQQSRFVRAAKGCPSMLSSRRVPSGNGVRLGDRQRQQSQASPGAGKDRVGDGCAAGTTPGSPTP
jgi:hypothetical protein